MSEMNTWREGFMQEWILFCEQQGIPTALCNSVARSLSFSMSSCEDTQRQHEGYLRSSAFCNASLSWWDVELSKQFRQSETDDLLTFEQWIDAVYNGQFKLRLIRNFGEVSERRLLATINQYIAHSTKTSVEYGYA